MTWQAEKCLERWASLKKMSHTVVNNKRSPAYSNLKNIDLDEQPRVVENEEVFIVWFRGFYYLL